MENQREEDSSLLNVFLPKGILEYFTITKVDQFEESINIHFEEKNIVSLEYANDKLTSKGFYDEIYKLSFCCGNYDPDYHRQLVHSCIQ